MCTFHFLNFNNAVSPIKATITADGLDSGYVLLEETSVYFNAQNLAPFATEPPAFVSIYNIGNDIIVVKFDKKIVSIDAQTGFGVSGYEPEYSPDGDLVVAEYTTGTIEMLPVQILHQDDLSSGEFYQTRISGDGGIALAPDLG